MVSILDHMTNTMNSGQSPAMCFASLIGLLDISLISYHSPNLLTGQSHKYMQLIQVTMDIMASVMAEHSADFFIRFQQILGGDEAFRK